MPHVREQLALAIVARVSGLPITGSRVFRRRADAEPLDPLTEVPGLKVWTESDQADLQGIGPVPLYDRPTFFRIEAAAKRNDDAGETQLNAIGSEVETAMGAPFSLGSGQEFHVVYLGAVFADSGEGDEAVSTLSMRFQGSPITEHGAPDVAV